MKLNIVKDYIKDAKATVIIVHGILEHLGRYEHVKDHLNKQGYSVVRYDQRGHGLSDGKPGAIKSFHDLIDDLHSVVLLEKQKTEKQIYLLGHSLGGLVVNMYVAKFGDVDGVISIGAATYTPKDAMVLKHIGFWYLRWLRLSAKRLDNKLSRDPEVLAKKKKDPLMLDKYYISLIGEALIKGVKFLHQNINNMIVPIVYLHGSADKIVSASFSKKMFDIIPAKDKSLKIYDGAYHEILNEINKKEVLTDITNWLNERVR